MYQVVASDLDGTFTFSRPYVIPLRQRNPEAAHRARHQLCVATGRHHVDVGKFAIIWRLSLT
ncbi:HAD hydrolase family protein [Shigella flexneri]